MRVGVEEPVETSAEPHASACAVPRCSCDSRSGGTTRAVDTGCGFAKGSRSADAWPGSTMPAPYSGGQSRSTPDLVDRRDREEAGHAAGKNASA